MITPDTSTLIAFFAGESGKDVDALARALEEELIVLTPPVLAEMLSDPNLPKKHETAVLNLPLVGNLKDDYWHKVGRMRREILARRLKARLADCLIAQTCIDHKLSLISRDKDFLAIARHSKLKLI